MPRAQPNLANSESVPGNASGASTTRVFYGWWVLAALTMVVFAGYGGGLYAFVVFVTPLEQEFGWSRAVTGGAVSIFWVSALLCPFLGAWADRRDPRSLMLLGALIEGGGLMLIAVTNDAWQLYALRAAMGVGKIMLLVPVPVVLARWFVARKGVTLGIAFSGAHLGGLILAPTAQFLIDALGWRTAAVVLGAVIVLVTIPLVAMVLRVQRPSELGLFPDGRPPSTARAGSPPEPTSGFTIGETLRTGLFWTIIGVTVILYLSYAGVLAHVTAYLVGQGVSASAAAGALGLTAGLAIFGVLGFGTAAGRWNIRVVLVTDLTLFAVGVGMLLLLAQGAPTTWLLYAFIVTFGLAIGGCDVIWVTLLRVYFGERDYGAIWGSWYMVCLASLAAGPILVGSVYDATQSYHGALTAIVASNLAGAAIMLFARMHKPLVSEAAP